MSNTTLNSLLKEYEQKKLNAELDLEKRKQNLYKLIPRLEQIDTELSTLVFANQIVVANASHAADVKMYNVAGICVGTYAFEVGYNDVKMPSEAGVYTMQVVYNSDKIQVIRIVVRQ